MAAETDRAHDPDSRDQPPPAPDREALLAWVADLRTSLRYHQQLGIRAYPLTPDLQPQPPRPARAAAAAPSPARPAEKRPQPPVAPASAPAPVSAAAARDRLARLQGDIAACTSCTLASIRQGQVPGRGGTGAPLMVIGDYSLQESGFSPAVLFGAAEDAMLANMMRAMGLAPEQVYVSNAVKCCPPPGWQPAPECPQCCLGHLRREIELIRPRVLCAMGDLAARSLLGGDGSVLRLRGRFQVYRPSPEAGASIRVMVTFHPRFLLANQDMKKAAWQDLQMVQRQLQQG